MNPLIKALKDKKSKALELKITIMPSDDGEESGEAMESSEMDMDDIKHEVSESDDVKKAEKEVDAVEPGPKNMGQAFKMAMSNIEKNEDSKKYSAMKAMNKKGT